MSTVTFNYHIKDLRTVREVITSLMDEGLSMELAELVADQRPFYQVQLSCEADEDTGALRVIEAVI